MNWGQKGFSSLFALVLAAILGPEPAGLMALALAFVLFVQMLLEGGLTSALVQRKNLEPQHLTSVFWTTLALSATLAGIAFVLAPQWAAANEAPELAGLIRALTPLLPLAALTIVQESDLRRRMDFRALAIRSTVGVLIGGTAGTIAAVAGLGVWSLVVQSLTQAVVSVALLWGLGAFRPTFAFSFRHLREVLGFSGWVFLDTFGAYANRYSHTIIMGLFFSPVAVGLYTVMARARDLIVTVTSRALTTVALPEFSRHQDDAEHLRERYIRCIALASMLTIPPLVLMAVVGEPIVMLLGAKWTPYAGAAGLALALLCLQSLTAPVSMFTSSLLQATGRPGASAAFTWAASAITIATYIVAGVLLRDRDIADQVVGIAAARLGVVLFFTLPAQLFMARKAANVSVAQSLAALGPAAFAAAAAAGVALAARTFTPIPSYPALAQLAILSVLFALVSLPIAFALEPACGKLVQTLRAKLARISPREPQTAELDGSAAAQRSGEASPPD